MHCRGFPPSDGIQTLVYISFVRVLGLPYMASERLKLQVGRSIWEVLVQLSSIRFEFLGVMTLLRWGSRHTD